jgi:transcriptional regulator with XRE-family HTH domain
VSKCNRKRRGIDLDDLKKYLETQEMSAYELAKRAGVHPSILCRFLSGKTGKMSANNAEKISRATLWSLSVTALLYPNKKTEVYPPSTIVLRERGGSDE